jgi:hypothetical protein
MSENVDFKWISEDSGVPLSSVYLYNRTGEGPRSYKVGRRYWVTRADYDQWLREKRGQA